MAAICITTIKTAVCRCWISARNSALASWPSALAITGAATIVAGLGTVAKIIGCTDLRRRIGQGRPSVHDRRRVPSVRVLRLVPIRRRDPGLLIPVRPLGRAMAATDPAVAVVQAMVIDPVMVIVPAAAVQAAARRRDLSRSRRLVPAMVALIEVLANLEILAHLLR
jgi:hypothetical protein